MIYKFKAGSHLKGDAQSVGEKLESLRGDGGLTATMVVDAAKTDNVLNPYFEWNDKKAARGYRESQARHLIACVCVEIERDKDEPVTTRAFVNVTNEAKEREYTSVQTAMSDELMRGRLLKSAMQELETFKRKYQDLKELAPVFKALDSLVA